MTGVNELAEIWENGEAVGGLEQATFDIRYVSRTAWHPASDPPTEADANENGHVLVYYGATDGVIHEAWWKVDDEDGYIAWARIRDVVLLPPEDA